MSDTVIASRQNLKILYALAEEITSLEDIFVNGVSIAGQEMAFAYTKGAVNQAVIPGFDSIVSAVTPGITVVQANPLVYIAAVVGYKSPEAIEVGIHLSEGLYTKNDNGSTVDVDVQLDFAVRILNTGDYVPIPKSYKKSTKSLTAFRAAVLIQRPDFIPETSAWQLRVTRATVDSDNPGSVDFPVFVGKTEINFTTYTNTSGVTYAGTSLLALHIEDVSLINNQFPQVSCRAKGMKFYVPVSSHYNPVTKTYADEAWTGDFEVGTVYTSNISWQLLSILSDALTKTIPIDAEGTKHYTYTYSFGVPFSEIGIWSFYNFAKYCDETFQGLPRYEFNKQFLEKLPRRQFVDALLSVANARLCRKHGLLCVAWDRYLTNLELSKVPLFIPEMTDDGFDTSDTHLSERYTHMVAIYEDLNNNNIVATVQSDSTDLMIFLKSIGWYPAETPDMFFVTKFGYKATSVDLAGATNYITAVIKARGLLWDALMGNEFVSFTGGLEFSSYYEGQVIGILDSSLSLAKKTGRIVSFTNVADLYTIVLDAPLTLTPSDFIFISTKEITNFTEERLTLADTLLTLIPVKVAPHTSNFAPLQTSKLSDTWIFSLTEAPIENTPFLLASNEISYWTIVETDLVDDRIKLRAKIYHQQKFDFIAGTYDRSPLNQVFSALPPVTAITPTVAVHEGLTSSQVLVELVFSHTINLTIAQTHVILYDISIIFFDGSTQNQRISRSMTNHALTEVNAPNPASITNELTTSMDHFASFSFVYQNFLQYFKDGAGGYNATLTANLTISISASVFDTMSGIKPSFPIVYKDVVTLSKPVGSSTIVVG